MSAKVNAGHGNPILMSLQLANQILGRCRAKARALKMGRSHELTGNDLKAANWRKRAERGLSDKARKEQAAKLRASRAEKVKPPAAEKAAKAQALRDKMLGRRAAFDAAEKAKPGPSPARERAMAAQRSRVGKAEGRGTAERLAKARALRRARGRRSRKSRADSASSKSRTSARRPRHSRAGGRTGTMFDMKRGDIKGQTTLMDRFGTEHTHGKTTVHLQGSPSKDHGIELKPMPKVEEGRRRVQERARTAEKLKSLKPLRDLERAPEIHAKAGDKADIGVEHIHVDPERFQFKIGAATHTGSVGSLAGVKKFDPELAGHVGVSRDPENGKVFVVNGHNRLDLAKKTGTKKIAVKFYHAATAEEARSKGALTNIAEGRGTSTDAAKFFRDTGLRKEHIEEAGVPLREKVASEGLDLARLDKPFHHVTQGELSPARGAIIGGSGLSHEQQYAVHTQLEASASGAGSTTGHCGNSWMRRNRPDRGNARQPTCSGPTSRSSRSASIGPRSRIPSRPSSRGTRSFSAW